MSPADARLVLVPYIRRVLGSSTSPMSPLEIRLRARLTVDDVSRFFDTLALQALYDLRLCEVTEQPPSPPQMESDNTGSQLPVVSSDTPPSAEESPPAGGSPSGEAETTLEPQAPAPQVPPGHQWTPS